MNLIKIDGRVYDVIVKSISRAADIRQSENAGTTLAPGHPEILDPLGTYITYNITFACRNGYEKEYDELYDCVIKPRSTGVNIEVVYGQTTLKYESKFSVMEQGIRLYDKHTGKVYWSELTVSCIPTKAQVLP